MPSLSEIMYGKYLENEYGYQIDAGDGGGLSGRLNEQQRLQVTIPSEEAWKRLVDFENGAPSGPPYKSGAPPLSEQCAGLGYGGAITPGYDEYIGYSEVKDCTRSACWGDFKYTSYLGTPVCAKVQKWSGGRCAKTEEILQEQNDLRKSFYESALKPFYANENSVGGFTKYAYDPFPLANQELERRLLYGKEIRGSDNSLDPGIDASCQEIMQGTIKRLIESSYIAGYIAVAPMVIKDIAITYAFYAQQFIDTFKPYNPPPPPPPDDGLS